MLEALTTLFMSFIRFNIWYIKIHLLKFVNFGCIKLDFSLAFFIKNEILKADVVCSPGYWI